MVLEATRGFRAAVDRLDRTEVPAEMRTAVTDWYADTYLPLLRRTIGAEPVLSPASTASSTTFP